MANETIPSYKEILASLGLPPNWDLIQSDLCDAICWQRMWGRPLTPEAVYEKFLEMWPHHVPAQGDPPPLEEVRGAIIDFIG